MIPIALLFPPAPRAAPRPPEATVFGRAALQLREEGVEIVIGDAAVRGQFTGVVATPAGWAKATRPVLAAYNRYPAASRPEGWSTLQRGLGDLPICNPDPLVRLCRDKLTSQRVLEAAGVSMPEVRCCGPELPRIPASWDGAFLKPRFGSFGQGVTKVPPGAPVPSTPDWILQRAVPAPDGVAGISVRQLMQRLPNGEWVAVPAAVRVSTSDPVVNRARGAEVHDASSLLGSSTLAHMHAQSQRICETLSAQAGGIDLAELGLDFVIDHQGHPHAIEVNGKPRGRLEVLAAQAPERYGQAHREAVLRPLRYAAYRASFPRSNAPVHE